MTWTAISGTVPQYSTNANALAQDYYIKFYASGTTTPINMATDTSGATQLAKCALNNGGYPITNPLDDTTTFIPHIDQTYRIVLYSNETDADNDDTGNAVFNIDGLAPSIAPSADASDIALRDTTVEAQDDYDRSPLFVDGTDFTAGAGPHVITVPSGWVPTNADMRFYRLDNSGIVTPLTPTAKTATTFTIAETLLSTDVLFIGDDNFRNQFDGDAADIRTRLDVYSKAEADAIPSYTDFVGANRTYALSSDEQQLSNFDASVELTAGVLTSIGPTGSGATYIWTALDNIPLDAAYIDIGCDVQAINNAGASAEQSLLGRDGDGTAKVKIGHAYTRATGATYTGARSTGGGRLKLGSSNIFYLQVQSNGATDFAFVWVAGFGI